jgi:hypothetical protein
MPINIEAVGKKVLFFFLVGLSVWTLTKIPFFMAYSPIADNDFNRAGVTATVNLVQWIHRDGGYHGNKLKSPAANFFLVHMMFGITVLVMIALPLLNRTWRRQYGYITFTFAILLGLHTLPAALEHDLWIPFGFTCLYVIVTAIFGFRTLRNYNNDPARSEKHLEVEYYIIAFGAWGAGFAEILLGIIPNMIKHAKDGVWPPSNFVGPNPLAGKTAYDILPESVGYTAFLILVAVFWVAWPMHLLTVDTTAPVPPEAPVNTEAEPLNRRQYT